MANNKVTALNTLSGQVAEVNASALTHPVFSTYLVAVPEGTKSYSPDKYKSQTADEYREYVKSKKEESAKTPEAKPAEVKTGFLSAPEKKVDEK